MKVVAGISIFCMVLAYQLWPYMIFGYQWFHFSWHSFFYQFFALGVSLLFFSFWQVTKWLIVEIGFWLSINNLIDEMTGTTNSMGTSEIIFTLIILIRCLHQLMKKPAYSQN